MPLARKTFPAPPVATIERRRVRRPSGSLSPLNIKLRTDIVGGAPALGVINLTESLVSDGCQCYF